MITNLLAALSLNIWYNMMMLVSGAVFILCAMGFIPSLPPTPTLLASAGVFFLSFGERTNHYLETVEIPVGDGMTRSQKMLVRKNIIPGYIMYAVGFLLLIRGAYAFLSL